VWVELGVLGLEAAVLDPVRELFPLVGLVLPPPPAPPVETLPTIGVLLLLLLLLLEETAPRGVSESLPPREGENDNILVAAPKLPPPLLPAPNPLPATALPPVGEVGADGTI
jgi:hypothetical protein